MNLIEMFALCKERNASDLHLSSNLPPLLRIAGRLEKFTNEPMSREEVKGAIYSLLNEEQKERFEKEKELDFSVEIPNLARFRANIYSQRRGESGAFRLIPLQVIPLSRLGLPKAVESFTTLLKGFVLVTGPTGSGKSTTLAAIIDVINQNRTEHIITIEDPIEYVYENKKCLIDQREVGTNTGSFYGALRNALREDPDVILVGEMRDLETISMALTAAETGHLVFATLHTNNAPQTISRIVDVFPSAQQQQIRTQLADTIAGIISQTLIPTVDGRGRVCATEVMIGTPAIQNLIRDGKVYQIPSLIQTGKSLGMHSMDQSLESLFLQKRISKEEAMKRAINKEVFTKYQYGYTMESRVS